MRTFLHRARGFVALVVVSSGLLSAAEPCSYFSVAEASALLKQPVAVARPMGPEKDEDSSGTVSHCLYQGANAAVIVTIVEFASAAEAQKRATQEFVNKQMDVDDTKTTADTGVGERTFWSVSPEGAAITFLKGKYVAQIGLGGEGVKQPAMFKAALKAAAVALAGKI